MHFRVQSRLSSFFLISTSLASPPRTIYQFPNPTWLENIFATRDGSLLTSIIGLPELHLVDPFSTPPASTLIASFPSANAVYGITELIPNNFAIVVGTSNTTTGLSQGYSIWTVHLHAPSQSSSTTFKKVASLPDAELLNGITTLNSHTVLIADSSLGHIVKLDTRTGKYETAIEHPSMKPVPGAPLKIGINGVKIHKEWLYYSNSFQNSINRVRIDDQGYAVGRFVNISNVTIPDDFAVTEDGSVIVGRPVDNDVSRVWLDGTVENIAGNLNSSVVAGATGVTLGRTWRDRGIAYVCTNGGQSTPVNGTYVEGGKIVAIGLE